MFGFSKKGSEGEAGSNGFNPSDTIMGGCGEVIAQEQIVLTPQEIAAGKRPGGYLSTSGLIREMHRTGKRLREYMGTEFIMRWNKLVRKGRKTGFTSAESRELVQMSVEIDEKLGQFKVGEAAYSMIANRQEKKGK